MASPKSYQLQTRTVRGAARAHLQKLRAERLARRKPTASPLVTPVSDAVAEAAAPQPKLAVSRAASEALSAQAAPPLVQETSPAPSPVELPPTDAPVPDTPPATCDTPTAEAAPAARDDMGQDGDEDPASLGTDDLATPVDATAPFEADADATATPDSTPDATPDTDAPSSTPDGPQHVGATDLDSLPGAGVGLIWMLQQCGVSTLTDLAKADADTLTAEMGLVGELLDLQAWIDLAGQTDRTAASQTE